MNETARKYVAMFRQVKIASAATVDEDGIPQSRIINVMLAEDDGMYIVTSKGKPFYKQLTETGAYTITDAMKERLGDFYGNYATEAETAGAIRRMYEKEGYVMDTHTAVASCVYEKYVNETKDTAKTMIASTASPYKFARSVMEALGEACVGKDDFQLVDELERLSGVIVPKAVEEIRTAPVRHTRVCDAENMKEEVCQILGIH